MLAFHSIWTEPSHLKFNYVIKDYNLLVAILSALNWRKYNGPIKLIADEYAINYITKLGITHIWNGGIEKLHIESGINPDTFWAAGKLFALTSQNQPCVMIDTDLIVWKNLDSELESKDIVTIHRERICDSIYPNKDFFKMKEGYRFNEAWNWEVEACNTALLYIKDLEFKNYYISQSIDFMKNSLETSNDVCNMVFAEQRLLSMCAYEKYKNIFSLIDLGNLKIPSDYTHIWGYKQILEDNPDEKRKFEVRCIKRILSDFPEEKETLKKLNYI